MWVSKGEKPTFSPSFFSLNLLLRSRREGPVSRGWAQKEKSPISILPFVVTKKQEVRIDCLAQGAKKGRRRKPPIIAGFIPQTFWAGHDFFPLSTKHFWLVRMSYRRKTHENLCPKEPLIWQKYVGNFAKPVIESSLSLPFVIQESNIPNLSACKKRDWPYQLYGRFRK